MRFSLELLRVKISINYHVSKAIKDFTAFHNGIVKKYAFPISNVTVRLSKAEFKKSISPTTFLAENFSSQKNFFVEKEIESVAVKIRAKLFKCASPS
jgi:hypothetical protein